MRLSVFAALMLCVSSHLCAQPVELDVSTLYEWPQRTIASWDLRSGDLEVQLRRENETLAGVFDPAVAAAFAVTLPWMRLGPLRATGIIREASDPLGFTVQSGVFRERTGLAVKGSLPAGEPGFLCMPVPDDVGLFCIPLPDGGLEYGCFYSLPPRRGMSAEGCVTLSRPAAAQPEEEWYCDVPAYPGGSLLDAAGRLLLRFPVLSIAVSAGSSTGERVEPGMFGHLRLSAEGGGMSASLLIGGADAAYRTPDGEGAAGMLVLSALVEAARSPCGVQLGYTAEIGRPGFAPGLVIPSRETVTMALERTLPRDREKGTPEMTGAVEARKRISLGADGCRTEAARYCARVRTAGRAGEGQAEIGWSDADGWGCSLACQSPAAAGLVLGLDAELEDLASGEGTGSLLVRIQYRGGDRAASVRAGLDACPLAADAAALPGHLVLRISWTQVTRLAGAQ